MIASQDKEYFTKLVEISREAENFKKSVKQGKYEIEITDQFAESLLQFEAIKSIFFLLIL